MEFLPNQGDPEDQGVLKGDTTRGGIDLKTKTPSISSYLIMFSCFIHMKVLMVGVGRRTDHGKEKNKTIFPTFDPPQFNTSATLRGPTDILRPFDFRYPAAGQADR